MSLRDYIHEAKAHVKVTDVIGGDLALSSKKVIRCPFDDHEDRKASFHIADDRGRWRCYGCGQGGDHIDWLRRWRGLSLKQAVDELGKLAGMAPFPWTDCSADEIQSLQTERGAEVRRLSALEKATRTYEEERRKSSRAKEYLASRGMDEAEADRWRLGYAPKTGGIGLLRKAELTAEEGLEAGLVRRSKNDGAPYPQFRDRVILPYMANGEVTYLSGRALGDAEPKYLHLPGRRPVFNADALRGNHPVFLSEGVVDVIALERLGHRAVGLSGKELPREILPALRRGGREVYVLLDREAADDGVSLALQIAPWTRVVLLSDGKDDPGELGPEDAEALKKAIGEARYVLDVLLDEMASAQGQEHARTLRALASTVAKWELDEAEMKAVRDRATGRERCRLGRREYDRLVRAALARKREEKRARALREGSGRPIIVVSGQQSAALIESSWDVLRRQNEKPRLFRQENELVYLGTEPDDAKKPDPDRKPAILPVTYVIMNGMLLRAANWVVQSEEATRPSKPPKDVPRDMVDYRPLPPWVPPLDGLLTSPSYGPDLELIGPGYHEKLKLYHFPSIRISPPEDLTEEQMADALQQLDCLLTDFPFKDSSDRANCIGVFLLALLRPAIVGNVPLIAIVSPLQRSGKSALSSILEILTTGTNASAVQYTKNEENFQKALLPYIQRGQPIVRLDNLDDGSRLHSPHLSSAITEGHYADRVLGLSKVITVPVKCVFVVTGNNISVSRDLIPRTMWIRLAPKTPEPGKREFAIKGIEQHVKDRRADYLMCLSTMVEFWKAKGATLCTREPWNSFNPFAQIIGGVLEACGIDGFLGNAEEQRHAGDPREEEWRRTIQFWYKDNGGLPAPASELLDKVFGKAVYINIKGTKPPGQARSLSKLLSKQVGVPRFLPDGTIVNIQKELDPALKVNTFSLALTNAPGKAIPPEAIPHHARTTSPCPAKTPGDNGDNGDNLKPPVQDGQESPAGTPNEIGEPETHVDELSPVSPLSPGDLTPQGVTGRTSHGDNGDDHDERSRPTSATPWFLCLDPPQWKREDWQADEMRVDGKVWLKLSPDVVEKLRGLVKDMDVGDPDPQVRALLKAEEEGQRLLEAERQRGVLGRGN